jgi:hypothetical protein
MGRRFEILVAFISLAVGVLLAAVASYEAPAHIGSEFYSTVAQILPVFLIVIAVEQRLVDRMGMSEEEHARRALQSLDLAVKAQVAYEDMAPEEGRRLEELFDAQPQFAWVGRLAMDFVYPGTPDDLPDIEQIARSRYRDRRRNEAVFLVTTITMLVLGECAALSGALAGGTSSCSPCLWVTVAATATAFIAITVGGARELVQGIHR